MSGCGTPRSDESNESPSAPQSSTDSSASEFTLKDRTAESGLSFTYRNGEETENLSILESLGGGVGVIDVDLDGRPDLFFPGGGSLDSTATPAGKPAALFRNGYNWTFADITSDSRVDSSSSMYSHGVAVGDFDNDGFPDVAVSGYRSLQLWQNQGDGTFVEQSDAVGLTDEFWSSSVAWGDINSDGSPDLFVVHYVDWSPENHPICLAPQHGKREVCPPRQFRGVGDSLFLSRSDGTFYDGTHEVGLSPEGKGLGVVIVDLDLDGDVDVYVTNDTVENFLYENKDGRLADVSLLSGSSVSDRGVPEGSMGVDVFDYNRDGLPDLWVVNYENESAALYENLGQLRFRHVSQRAGITGAAAGLYVGWGTCCFDVNLNGLDDIFVSNGHVIRYPANAPRKQTPLLFENMNAEKFRNVSSGAGTYLSESHDGRGCVRVDLDLDGLQDLVISRNNEPVRLLQNTSVRRGRSLRLDLTGISGNRDATGAFLTLSGSDFRQVKHVIGGGSFASTNSRTVHFGIPEGRTADSIEIAWPGGQRQTLKVSEQNEHLKIIEGREASYLIPF